VCFLSTEQRGLVLGGRPEPGYSSYSVLIACEETSLPWLSYW